MVPELFAKLTLSLLCLELSQTAAQRTDRERILNWIYCMAELQLLHAHFFVSDIVGEGLVVPVTIIVGVFLCLLCHFLISYFGFGMQSSRLPLLPWCFFLIKQRNQGELQTLS